jgi:aminoacylase
MPWFTFNLSPLEVKFVARGKSGHASSVFDNTAAEKIRIIINKLLMLRSEEKKRLDENPGLGLGDISSINMTMMEVP